VFMSSSRSSVSSCIHPDESMRMHSSGATMFKLHVCLVSVSSILDSAHAYNSFGWWNTRSIGGSIDERRLQIMKYTGYNSLGG